MAEQPSELTMAAIRMAQHVIEARRAREEAKQVERRARMALVKRESTEVA